MRDRVCGYSCGYLIAALGLAQVGHMPGSRHRPLVGPERVLERHPGRAYDERMTPVRLTIETERETDGRWIADVRELPGVMAYGQTPVAAVRAVKALALRVIAERFEHGELETSAIEFEAA